MRRRTLLAKNKGGNIITATYQGRTYETRLLGDDFNIDNIDRMYINGVEVEKTIKYNHKKDEIFDVIFEMTDELTDLSYMFYFSYIKTCDFTQCDLSKVTNMSHMFYSTNFLISLNLEGVDTSSLTTMEYTFNEAGISTVEGEEEIIIDLTPINTSNVTNMFGLFRRAGAVFDISGWDTSKVTDMSYMFSDTYSIILTTFDTSNVTNMTGMFEDSFTNIVDIILPKLNTSNVTNMSYMFASPWLGYVDLNYLDTSKVTDMSWMFYEFNSSTYSSELLDFTNFNTSSVTSMSCMFFDYYGNLDITPFDTSNVTKMNSMFRGCSFKTINLSNLNTSNVTDMSQMFNYCKRLTSLTLTNFNTSNVKNMSYMFNGCEKLTTLNLSKFNLSKVTNMNYMFQNCTSLTSLTMTGARNVSAGFTTTTSMFKGITTTGTFNYKSRYYFDDILAVLPSTWTATAS